MSGTPEASTMMNNTGILSRKCTMLEAHRHEREDLGGQVYFLDQTAVADERRHALGEPGGESVHGNRPQSRNTAKFFDVDAHVDGKHQDVDAHHQQWVGERPEKAEHRAAVAAP